MLSALKNFGVTLLLALLIFGVIAYFATNFVIGTFNNIIDGDGEMDELDNIINQDPDGPDNPGTAEKDPILEQLQGVKSFDLLIVTSDYNPEINYDYAPTHEELAETDWDTVLPGNTLGMLSSNYRVKNISSIVLVRFDKESKQVLYTYISPLTNVFTPTGYHTLSEVYENYGAQSLRDHINAITGVSPDFMFYAEGYNLEKIAAELGAVSYYLSVPIYQGEIYSTLSKDTPRTYLDEEGEIRTTTKTNEVLVAEGNYLLDGTNLYSLLSVREDSSVSLSIKEAYVIEITQKYMELISSMTMEELAGKLSALMTPDEFGHPLLECDFRLENIEPYHRMISVNAEFDKKTVKFPATYTPADNKTGFSFDVELERALEVLSIYRTK